jgi:hypothetical protein
MFCVTSSTELTAAVMSMSLAKKLTPVVGTTTPWLATAVPSMVLSE